MDNSMEMRMQMRMQLGIVKDCFADCVNNFSADQLSAAEKSCLQNCAKRSVGIMQEFGRATQGAMAQQGGMQQF